MTESVYPPMTVISDASVEFNHHIGAPLIGKFKHLAMAVEHRGNLHILSAPKIKCAGKELLVPEKKGRDLKPFA
jgi:hypothetical protein